MQPLTIILLLLVVLTTAISASPSPDPRSSSSNLIANPFHHSSSFRADSLRSSTGGSTAAKGAKGKNKNKNKKDTTANKPGDIASILKTATQISAAVNKSKSCRRVTKYGVYYCGRSKLTVAAKSASKLCSQWKAKGGSCKPQCKPHKKSKRSVVLSIKKPDPSPPKGLKVKTKANIIIPVICK
ncbi:hypothetical protein HDU97_006016 [Phlyctochytrium planicorne]|nr:hypothetical protein HDU97_006016 [Phlyctochytrium planicorne]